MNEKNIEYRSENFYIRKTDDRDYDNFRKVCEAEYLIGRIYKHQPKIAMKCFWETLFEGEDIHYSIFLQDGEFLGRVSLQYGRCKYPEIAIVVVKKYQNQGYGFKLLKEWCSWVHEVYGYSRLDILIDAENEPSIRLFRKLDVKITANGKVFNEPIYLMLVFNGQTAGNFKLATKAKVQDGLLDIVIFKACHIPELIPMFIKVLKGEHLEDSRIEYIRTDELLIESDEEIVTDIDGERGPDFPLRVQCIKDGIQVLGINK